MNLRTLIAPHWLNACRYDDRQQYDRDTPLPKSAATTFRQVPDIVF